MRFLKSSIHTDLTKLDLQSPTLRIYHRQATRAIVLNGDNILMLYTARYHDYTLPGGGIDAGEDQIQGLSRELAEETGAMNVRNIKPFGLYEEFRPWHKAEYDIVHMESFCYTCSIDEQLSKTQLEDYEQKNGMRPVWINIFDAIAHNEHTMQFSDKKGMSIERETFLLKRIVAELLSVSII